MSEQGSGRWRIPQFLLDLKTRAKIVIGLSIAVAVGVGILIGIVANGNPRMEDRDIAQQGYSPEQIPEEVEADLKYYWDTYWDSEGFDSEVRYVWRFVNVRGYEDVVCSSLDQGVSHMQVFRDTMDDFPELTAQDSAIIFGIAVGRGCDYHWD